MDMRCSIRCSDNNIYACDIAYTVLLLAYVYACSPCSYSHVIHTLYMHTWTQVNHLCPFFITLELLPIVLETASTSGDCRILFVSSSAHYKRSAGEVDFNSIDSEEMYTRTKAYGRTKLYNVRC